MASVEDDKKNESSHYLHGEDPLQYRFRPLLRVVQAAYQIPDSVTLEHFIPALRFTHHALDTNLNDNTILVTVGQIASGLRFPLTHLDREVLNFYEISPGQCNGNFWRIMYIANQANRLLQCKITLKDIRIHFQLKRVNKHNSFAPYFYFSRRKNKEHVIKKIRDSDKLWPDFPVMVRGKWESYEDTALLPLKHKHTVRGGYNLDSCGSVETFSRAIDELLALGSEQYTKYARVNDHGDPLPQLAPNFDAEGCLPPLYTHRKGHQVLMHQDLNVFRPSSNTNLLRDFSDEFSVGSVTDPMGRTNVSLDLSISSDNVNDVETSTTCDAWSKNTCVRSGSSSAGVSIADRPKEVHGYGASNPAKKADDDSNLESSNISSQTHTVEYHVKLSAQAIEQLEVSILYYLKRIKQLDELCSIQGEEIKNLSAELKEKSEVERQLESFRNEKQAVEEKLKELENQMKLERETNEKISSTMKYEHQQALINMQMTLLAEKEEALACQKAKLKIESDAEYEKLKAKYQKDVYEFKAKYRLKFAKAS